jgi:hypothetical protein
MDYSSSAILLIYSPKGLYARGLTLIGVLLTSAGGRGAVGHDFFSDGSIKEQAAWAEAA